uniref:Cytosol aminopeptidase domain-containing protein n=1 Tax=Guillardia theta TaxID=55529 RepID=A0A7S4HC55_GUITH
MYKPLQLTRSSVTRQSFPLVRMSSIAGNHPVFTDSPKLAVRQSTSSPKEWKGDLLFFPFPEVGGEDKNALVSLTGAAAELDASIDGLLSEIIKENEFKGKSGSSVLTRLAKSSSFKKLSLVGMGNVTQAAMASGFALGKQIASSAKTEKAKTAAVVVPQGFDSTAVKAMVQAVLEGIYHDVRFKSGDDKEKGCLLESLEVIASNDVYDDALVQSSFHINEGVKMARDLVGAPSNYVTPSTLAETARNIAKEHGMSCTILERDECERRGMGAYLAVSRGSAQPPKFIHVTYKPKGEVKKKIAIVGKGLCFDSGGYNLKAGAGSMIELMKFDMGGSAATLGCAKAVGMMKPEGVEVHFIVAACENMISSDAMRPGDILTASNGKTIEVLNTDAEGRLTLADALVYAEQAGAQEIVDIATLTGACIISLGDEYAGLWSNDETMGKELLSSFTTSGEKAWIMPLVKEYFESIKGKISDLKNIGGKGGGSITAALFLKEFVKEAKWSHLDIAGPVWNDKAGGATGYGVKGLTEWVVSKGK